MFAADGLTSPATAVQREHQQQQHQQQQQATNQPSTVATSTVATTNVSTPSSLTGFLAPGGQLPVHKDGGAPVVTGKPSIVKVTLTPPTTGQQQQHRQPDEQQQQQQHAPPNHRYPKSPSANNHQQAYQLPTTRSTDAFQSTPFRTSSANDWYYANYNRTNVEPFVSKTPPASRGAACAYPTSAPFTMVALLLSLAALPPRNE